VRQMQMVGVPHSLQSICKTQVGHLLFLQICGRSSGSASTIATPSFLSWFRGALPDSPSCMKVDHLCADAPQLVRWKNCSCETASGRNASAIRAR
jgi:hypothetical protein